MPTSSTRQGELGKRNGAAAEHAASSQDTPPLAKRSRAERLASSTSRDASPLNRAEPPVYRVAITGGPCAGKSTFLATILNTVEERTGVRVYCVPEAATLLVTGGLKWAAESEAQISNQLAVLKTQIALEDNFLAIARAAKTPALIVCDRGVMDGRAYCSKDQFEEVLRRGGYVLEELRDTRYDAVIHLVTAAIGASTHYNLDNPTRFENVDEAVEADLKLRNMYIGHPRVTLVDNSAGNFQLKLDRAIDLIYEIIGHRQPKHRTRRFLLRPPFNLDAIPVPTATVDIVITILSGSTLDNVKLLLKRDTTHSTFLFYNPSVNEAGDKTECQHMLSAKEYANLILQRDPAHADIKKRGVSFTYEDHFYEVAVLQEPTWCKGLGIVYVSCDDEKLKLPPWLGVERDTTGLPGYSSFELSRLREDADGNTPNMTSPNSATKGRRKSLPLPATST